MASINSMLLFIAVNNLSITDSSFQGIMLNSQSMIQLNSIDYFELNNVSMNKNIIGCNSILNCSLISTERVININFNKLNASFNCALLGFAII